MRLMRMVLEFFFFAGLCSEFSVLNFHHFFGCFMNFNEKLIYVFYIVLKKENGPSVEASLKHSDT